MKIFLYIFRDFLKFVLGIVFLCVFLFMMFDFIQKAGKYFPKYSPSPLHIALYYAYQVPSLAVEVLPIASLMASVITMVLLSRGNEVTAMRAAGMGPEAIGLPIAIGGALLSVIVFVGGEWVIPRSATRMHYVEQVLIEKSPVTEVADGMRWIRHQGELLHFESVDPTRRTITGLQIVDISTPFRPTKLTFAAAGEFDEEHKTWVLDNVRIYHVSLGGAVEDSQTFAHTRLELPIELDKLKKERREPNEMSMGELHDAISQGEETGRDTLAYRVDFHVKFAYPFAAFVVSLIGIKFAYRSERSLETARGILIAFAIGISYWFILNAARALGKHGTLPPFIAAWCANVVVFAVAVTMVAQSRKSN